MLTRFAPALITAVLTCALPLATAPAAPAADLDPAGCRAVPVDADIPLRSAEARAAFGVDGTGVTVGVISDSFGTATDVASTPAEDVAVGSLPGPGNPCGRTVPVKVLVDSAAPATDEGRAMLQLVHGVAPGAELLFASDGADQFAMADNILALAAAGADVIVDDVTELDEPLYQRGPIELAAEQVRSQGVVYLSAASNYNVVGSVGSSVGKQIGSWETLAYRPAECPAAVAAVAGAGSDCLDFDPAAGVDPTMEFGVGVGVTLGKISLDWAEPWFGVEQEFAVLVLRDGVPIGDGGDFSPEISSAAWIAELDPTDPAYDPRSWWSAGIRLRATRWSESGSASRATATPIRPTWSTTTPPTPTSSGRASPATTAASG